MKRFFLAAIMAASVSALANPTLVNFKSQNPWTASRWYLVGQFSGKGIQWLNGGVTRINFDVKKCGDTPVLAPARAELADHDAEVLLDSAWIAVQVDPDRKADVLELRYGKNCEAKVVLKWAPDSTAQENVLTPHLFLNPTGNMYTGYQFDVAIPKELQAPDILIDVVAGAWNLKLGNPGTGAKSSLILAPVVEARGEWNPRSLGRIGFELHMLQGLSSFGGVSDQDILISEWMAGAYFQNVFAIGQGLALRLHADFFQHLADQGTGTASIGAYEADHRGINVGLSASQYFSKRWFVHLRGDYGYPSSMAGQGVNQSFLRYRGRVGYLVTESVTWLLEGAYRSYGYSGHNTTTAVYAGTGFRLEL